MIEVVTTNGFRRSVHPYYIVTIAELRNSGRSNSVITLSNGESVFVDDTYESVKAKYSESQMKTK